MAPCRTGTDQFVEPDDTAFQAAAAGADWKNAPGFGAILTNQAGKASWPITGASFILMHVKQEKPVGLEVLKFYDWAFKNGQKMAEELDYVPLPPALVAQIADARGRRRSRTPRASPCGIDGIVVVQNGCIKLLIAAIPATDETWRPAFRARVIMSASSATAAFPTVMIPDDAPRAARDPTPPARRQGAPRWQDWLFEQVTLFFALLVLGLLAGILIALGIAAAPALEKFGIGFFFTNVWNPVKGIFGGLAPIYGTLVTSAIALVIGVPVSFGIALFLTEMCPVDAQATAGHRRRASGRDSVDHLRHLGTVHLRPALR